MSGKIFLQGIALSLYCILLTDCSLRLAPLPRDQQVLFDQPMVAFSGHWPLWEADSRDTDRALYELWLHLKSLSSDTTRPEIEQVLAHRVYKQFADYRVQMIPVMKKNQKFLLLNFFPAAWDYPDWQQRLVSVPEKGDLYWTAEYNCSRTRVQEVSFF